jgi:hypothetical protein
VPGYDDDSTRRIDRSKVRNKLEPALCPLSLIETEIHNNHLGTMASKKSGSAIHARRSTYLEGSDTWRERPRQTANELPVIVDKKDITHIERSRALKLVLNDCHWRNTYSTRYQTLLKLDAEAPLVRPHNEISHNRVDHRALTELTSGETAPRRVSSDLTGRLRDPYRKDEAVVRGPLSYPWSVSVSEHLTNDGGETLDLHSIYGDHL